MTNQEIIKSLQVNLVEADMIKDIKPLWKEGSMDGSDNLEGIIIRMDNRVETELKILVHNNKLILKLSQIEMVPGRKTYAEN